MAKRATAVATRNATKPVANDTPERYYGMVIATSESQEDIVRMGVIVQQALADKQMPHPISVIWVKHKDGVESIDARWIRAQWVKAEANG